MPGNFSSPCNGLSEHAQQGVSVGGTRKKREGGNPLAAIGSPIPMFCRSAKIRWRDCERERLHWDTRRFASPNSQLRVVDDGDRGAGSRMMRFQGHIPIVPSLRHGFLSRRPPGFSAASAGRGNGYPQAGGSSSRKTWSYRTKSGAAHSRPGALGLYVANPAQEWS